MKHRSVLTLSLAVAMSALYINGAYAETPAEAAARELDITMTVVEDELPDPVIQRIELPLEASPQGVISSARGLDIANTARQEGREFGAAVSEQARTIGETARGLSGEGGATVRESVKDAISSGDLGGVPGEVRDNLPPQARDNLPGGPGAPGTQRDNLPGGLPLPPQANPGQ